MKSMKSVVALAMGAGLAVQSAFAAQVDGLAVTGLRWNSAGATIEVSVSARASAKARTVYLVWDDADRGENWLDWSRGEILGTLPAGATAASFAGDRAYRYAKAFRVFTFDPSESGDGYLASVRSTCKQSVATSHKPNRDTAIFVDYSWTSTNSPQQRVYSSNSNFIFHHYMSGNYRYAYACRDASSKAGWTNYGDVVDTNRVALTIDSYADNYRGFFRLEREGVVTRLKVLEDTYAAATERTKTATDNLTIFSNPGGTSNLAGITLYRLVCRSAGVTVGDFRPYVKDGVAGLLDSVDGSFHASSTATALVAGPRLGAAALEVSPAAAPMRIDGETYSTSNLPGGPTSDLADTSLVVLRDGTFKYAGRDGEKGVYAGDVAFAATDAKASTFDVTGDLTLSGSVDNPSTYGSFVKTGPGTLRIPGTKGVTSNWKLRGLGDDKALLAYAPKADGTTPDQGYTWFSLTEGRLVLGENGGNFTLSQTSSSDLQIGTMTVDPLTQAGQQEKDAVLEIAGGTTTINGWVTVGAKNGFVTTCPEKVPESGIRVTGGKLYCKASFTLGRNKSSVPQTDAAGNFIAPRCRPFIEVLGGELRIWNTSRVGFCDNAGVDSRILVDTGLLYVCNKDNTTGAEIILGSSTDSENTASRTCETTIRNGGRLDCTGFRIVDGTSRINVTNRISVVDGGIWRINTFAKSSKQESCWSSILFDGGIGEIRYGGYTGWISADISRAAVGTRGATFRSGSCNTNVLDYVQVPLVADDTHPDEEPQGLTVGSNGTDKNAGFVLTQPNTYKGPTTITQYGRLEFAGEGAFPTASDVTLGFSGRLMLTNAAHAVKSFTLGNSIITNTAATLGLVADQPLTAGSFRVTGNTTVAISLYAAPNETLAAAGTYALVKAPASDFATLRTVAAGATWANAAEGLYATFTAAVEGEQAVLKAVVSETEVTPTLHPAAGGTETVDSLASIQEGDTGILRLGTGTLAYTGSGESLSNVVSAAGDGAVALQVAKDLTLFDFTSLSGRFYKTGPGDLYLMGTGEFRLGVSTISHDSSKPEGFDEEGNPPNNASQGCSIADGRMIVGVKDDPANAPHVIATRGFAVGVRTAARDSGKMETAGEVILNNGVIDATGPIIGYYNGYPETTPPEGLHPKITINGGRMTIQNDALFSMGQDWEGYQTTSPSLEINGGVLEMTNDLYVGYSVATGTVGDVATFTMNGGVVRLWDKWVKVGNSATSMKSVANFNGGDLYCANFYHNGVAASEDKGCAEVHFNGTAIHLGYGRSQGDGFTFMSETANKRFNKAYVGTGGLIIDFDEWASIGSDWGIIDLRQAFQHDPACEGTDGGITIRNGSTVIFRTEMNGSTFDGPITVENGSVLGMDMNWLGFTNMPRRVTVGPKSGIRFSGQTAALRTVTFGEAGATEPVTFDLCQPSGKSWGLFVLDSVKVLSPITVSFHRNGGICNNVGVWLAGGTIDLLTYPASCDADVPLEMFVANAKLPAMKVSFAKADVTTGAYAGCKKVTLTVEPSAAADDVTSGTAWNATASGGDWSDGANWDGGASVNATNALAQFKAAQGAAVAVNVDAATTAGRIVLRGDDAAKGYALSGQRINLQNDGWNVLAEVSALTGSHTLANDIGTDFVNLSNVESIDNGGTLGAIGISSSSNATLTVTGAVASNESQPIYVNPKTSGGGRTVFNATVTGGKGVQVRSGTLAIDNLNKLNGKTLTVGPATLHVTGGEQVAETPLRFESGSTTKTAVLRNDSRLVLNAPVVATNGLMMKTGPGELVLNATGLNRLGGEYSTSNWNVDEAWPDNGDSRIMGGSPFCLDEGTLTFGREGQHVQFCKPSGGDVFIGSQMRGWDYATDKVVVNMIGGEASACVLGIGHGMRRGATGDDLAYVEFNQYGGTFTNSNNVYIGYELTRCDSHIRASMNLYGGVFKMGGYMRLGQTYNKTGENEPYSRLLVDGGTLHCLRRVDLPGNIYVPYAESLSQVKNSQSRASDAELVIKSGAITNAYLVFVGQNGGRGEVHLDGGLLNCENLVHHTSDQTASASYYRAFNVPDGTSYVHFNGGVFQPMAEMWTAKDAKARLEWNATLTNFTGLVVEAGGARFDLTALKADAYAIAQTITGAAGDGGLVKTGAKPLVLAAPLTYFGDTVVAEGVLRVGAAAPEGDILPNSVTRLGTGATLEFESGAKATLSKLAVDCGMEGFATLRNVKFAQTGVLAVENAAGSVGSGYRLPIQVEGRAHLSKWQVTVNGQALEGGLRPVAKDGQLTIDLPYGTYVIVR